MAQTHGTSIEKVTFNMPTELKDQVLALKNELKISLSAIYNEAITNYLRQREMEKWQKGIDMAVNDREYMASIKELGSESGDIHEY